MTEEQEQEIRAFLVDMSEVVQKHGYALRGYDNGLYVVDVANGQQTTLCEDGDVELLDTKQYNLTFKTTKAIEEHRRKSA